jgi:hypothetical protein
VHLAQLGEREGLTEQGMRDAGVLHLVTQAPERVFDDHVVVERERRQLVGGEPSHVLSRRGPGGLAGADEGPVHDGDHASRARQLRAGAHERGAVGVAERVQLFQVARGEACRVAERAARGIRESLRHPQRPAGKRPSALERFPDAPHERQPEGGRQALRPEAVVAAQREDDGRDGQFHIRARRLRARQVFVVSLCEPAAVGGDGVICHESKGLVDLNSYYTFRWE